MCTVYRATVSMVRSRRERKYIFSLIWLPWKYGVSFDYILTIMIIAKIASLGNGCLGKNVYVLLTICRRTYMIVRLAWPLWTWINPAFPNTIVMAKVTGWFLHNSVAGMMVVRLGDWITKGRNWIICWPPPDKFNTADTNCIIMLVYFYLSTHHMV